MYIPLPLILTNTVASEAAKMIKEDMISTDIHRLNSVGLTGLSMDLVDTARRVEAIAGAV